MISRPRIKELLAAWAGALILALSSCGPEPKGGLRAAVEEMRPDLVFSAQESARLQEAMRDGRGKRHALTLPKSTTWGKTHGDGSRPDYPAALRFDGNGVPRSWQTHYAAASFLDTSQHDCEGLWGMDTTGIALAHCETANELGRFRWRVAYYAGED